MPLGSARTIGTRCRRTFWTGVLAGARTGGMRVLGAQALRLRGLLNGDADDLRLALREFEADGRRPLRWHACTSSSARRAPTRSYWSRAGWR